MASWPKPIQLFGDFAEAVGVTQKQVSLVLEETADLPKGIKLRGWSRFERNGRVAKSFKTTRRLSRACHTQEEIGEAVGVDQGTVARVRGELCNPATLPDRIKLLAEIAEAVGMPQQRVAEALPDMASLPNPVKLLAAKGLVSQVCSEMANLPKVNKLLADFGEAVGMPQRTVGDVLAETATLPKSPKLLDLGKCAIWQICRIAPNSLPTSLACHTQEEIGEAVGVSKMEVSRVCNEMAELPNSYKLLADFAEPD